MVVALRRRHPYEVFWMHERADAIARDTTLKGTALSAPMSYLLVQAALTAVVVRWPSGGAAQALGGLGALQVADYLGERLVRRRLRPSGWDRRESPLVVAGIGLAGTMAVLSRQLARRGVTVQSQSPVRARRGVVAGFAKGRSTAPCRTSRSGKAAAGAVLRAEPRARQPHRAGSTVRAPDAQVHGQTLHRLRRQPHARTAGRLTIRDLASHYAEAIARQFLGPVSVERISTGGSIAQQFAIDHPHMVRRLVLAATACRLSPHGRAVQRRFAELIKEGRPRRAYAIRCPTLAAEDAFDASPLLHRITAPTLLVTGGRDRFYSPELFRETAQRIPAGRLGLYPDRGHAGVLTHKRAIREIVAFLRADDQVRT